MQFGIFLCSIVLVILQGVNGWTGYEGYRVYSLTPFTDEELRFIHDLTTRSGDYIQPGPVRSHDGRIQLAVHPHSVHKTERLFNNMGLDFRVYMDNLQTHLDAEAERLHRRYEAAESFAFDIDDFNTLEDIMAELPNMAARCPADEGIICELFDFGTSFEGRPLTALRIYKDEADRMALWVDSGTHGGEWLPITTNLKIMDLMTRGYGTEDNVTFLIDEYDWYFVPVVNPDGYEFTWQEERFWRKSRNLNEGSECNGTDLNRNFDQMWMNAGSSSDPCSNNYAGSSPASEPETQAVSAEAVRLAPSLLGFVTLHSAAYMWLHPWGHEDEPGQCAIAEDEDWMIVISNAAADATQNTFNDTIWTRGNTCQTIYPASGTTMDFAKGGAGIDYTCTPEVRGPFDPSLEDIQLSYQEIWNGVQAMVIALRENPK